MEKVKISPLILPQASRQSEDLTELELEDSIVQLPQFSAFPRTNTTGTTGSLAPHSPRGGPQVSRLHQRRNSAASSWINHSALSRFISRGSNASIFTNEKAQVVPQMLKPPRVNYYNSLEGHTTHNKLSEVNFENLNNSASDNEECGNADNIYWLDVTNPTPEELDDLFVKFKLHPITIENIQSGSSIERWEHYENYLYVSLLALPDDLTIGGLMKDMRVVGTPVHLIILPFGIISIQLDFVKYQDKVLKRVNLIKSHLKIHSGWIAYAILDEVVDELTDVLKYLESKVEGIEDGMFVSKDDSIVNKKDDLTVDYQASLKVLGVVKYQVLGLSKLTHSKSEICKGLIKKVSNQNLAWEGIQLYLGDVEDHAVSLNQGIAHIETILRNLHACYTTHMSLKVIQQDQLSLTGSLRLTYFGAVVSVGLTVSGTWGMRMLVPGQPPDGELWSLDWFFGIVGVTLAVALILAYLANRFATNALASDTNTVMDPTKTIDYRPPNRAGLEEFNNRRNSIVTWLSKKVQGTNTNGSTN